VQDRDATEAGRSATKNHTHDPAVALRRREKFCEGKAKGEFVAPKYKKMMKVVEKTRDGESRRPTVHRRPHKHRGHKHRSTHHEPGEKKRHVKKGHKHRPAGA
jgi:hypothetical protein